MDIEEDEWLASLVCPPLKFWQWDQVHYLMISVLDLGLFAASVNGSHLQKLSLSYLYHNFILESFREKSRNVDLMYVFYFFSLSWWNGASFLTTTTMHFFWTCQFSIFSSNKYNYIYTNIQELYSDRFPISQLNLSPALNIFFLSCLFSEWLLISYL